MPGIGDMDVLAVAQMTLMMVVIKSAEWKAGAAKDDCVEKGNGVRYL